MAAILLFSTCEKDPAHVKPHATPVENAKSCSPWRNVTGYNALVSEINGFSVCNITGCSGSSVTQINTFYVLQQPNGSSFTFASNQIITPSDQTAVMNAGSTLAVANTPTGYFVSQITYSADIIVSGGSPTYAGIDITVVYRKCTGGGGGGS